jgi:hypothetical protein
MTSWILGLVLLVYIPEAAGGPSPVAVLELVPVKVDEYSVAPTADEMVELTARVRSGLASPRLRLVVLPKDRMPSSECADADCARRIGRNLGAHTVVFGTVVRLSGIRWNMQLTALDVGTGRIDDRVTLGTMGPQYLLGDYYSLLNSVHATSYCLGRSIVGESKC